MQPTTQPPSQPIIRAITDNDLYKFTMGQVAHQFPEATVRYRFINRDRRPFRPGFERELRRQIERMADLRLTQPEFDWLRARCPWLKLNYLQWLRQFRFDPDQVVTRQDGDQLHLEIAGPWIETIYWEVPLMGLISELHFAGQTPADDWVDRIKRKAEVLAAGHVNWIDFGSRRRFSYEVQDTVNEVMKPYAPLFRGTSNPHLAMKHDLTPHGTYAHELPMAMQARYGFVMCNKAAMDAWVSDYRGDLGIALTDTVTTDVFLRDFDAFYAKLFDGVRLDSGDPFAAGDKIVAHYQKLKIDPASKVLVFSDGLSAQKAADLTKHFAGRAKVTAGIGTHLTNDVGPKALNIVIKLVEADFGTGTGPVGLVKLSDEPGKHTGEAWDIENAKRVLRITA